MSGQNVSGYVAFAKGYREGRNLNLHRCKEILQNSPYVPFSPYDKGLVAGAGMAVLKFITRYPQFFYSCETGAAFRAVGYSQAVKRGSGVVKVHSDKLTRSMNEYIYPTHRDYRDPGKMYNSLTHTLE